jgi:Protein of unknown function (DUF3426)
MFTQCPDCRKTYPVTKKHKRGKKTLIFCGDCKKKFDASVLLNEKSTALVTEAKAEYIPKPEFNQKPSLKKKSRNYLYLTNIGGFLRKNISKTAAINPVGSAPVPERLPWEVEKKPVNVLWVVGFIMGSLLLLGQVIYFESAKLSQNSSYRPQLEKLCRWLGCQLPDYQNLNEFAVLQGSFTPSGDNTMVFKAVINNQAVFRQRLPNIKLTLLDYNEQIFAQRVFAPKDYSFGANTYFSIPPDENVTASLTIAAPKTPIGGYNFDLIY